MFPRTTGAGLVMRSASPALSDGTLAAERKGSGSFHVLVKGKAAHAGRDFASGRRKAVASLRVARTSVF